MDFTNWEAIWLFRCLVNKTMTEKRQFTKDLIRLRNIAIILYLIDFGFSIARHFNIIVKRNVVIIILNVISMIMAFVGLLGGIYFNVSAIVAHYMAMLTISAVSLIYFIILLSFTTYDGSQIIIFLPLVIDWVFVIGLAKFVLEVYRFNLRIEEVEAIEMKIKQEGLKMDASQMKPIQVALQVQPANQEQEMQIISHEQNVVNLPKPPENIQEKPDDEERSLCIICMVKKRDTIFYRCGHLVCCFKCAERLGKRNGCPVCRADIQDIVKTYQA